jgi:hypothetical protein
MAHYYPDLVRIDPMRRLSWRWDRASLLIEKGSRFSKRRDDEWTGRAMRYLRARSRSYRAGVPSTAIMVKPEHSDIHQARQLDAADDVLTWVVQARLLARQTGSEIGPLVSMDAAGVEAYESLFFNIRDRLEAKVYIGKIAIGWTSVTAAAGCDLETVVRWIGYFAGLDVLNLAERVLLPSMAGWGLHLLDCELATKIRELAAVLMMPQLDWKDQKNLLHLQTLLMEVTQLAGVNVDESLGDTFKQIVCKSVSDLSPKCFLPSGV